MSSWTSIRGVIEVILYGNTQHENTFIVNSIVDSLPHITGSEQDMGVYVNQEYGYDVSMTYPDLDHITQFQSKYLITINGSLRDREFADTIAEFDRWICELAKQLLVNDAIVEIESYEKSQIFTNREFDYSGMYDFNGSHYSIIKMGGDNE